MGIDNIQPLDFGHNVSSPKQLNLKELPNLECENPECDGTLFMPLYRFKVISALISPNGKQQMQPIEVYACSSCGHINKAFDL